MAWVFPNNIDQSATDRARELFLSSIGEKRRKDMEEYNACLLRGNRHGYLYCIAILSEFGELSLYPNIGIVDVTREYHSRVRIKRYISVCVRTTEHTDQSHWLASDWDLLYTLKRLIEDVDEDMFAQRGNVLREYVEPNLPFYLGSRRTRLNLPERRICS